MLRVRKVKGIFKKPWYRPVHCREDGWKGKVEARLRRDLNSKPTSLDFILDNGEPLDILGKVGRKINLAMVDKINQKKLNYRGTDTETRKQ